MHEQLHTHTPVRMYLCMCMCVCVCVCVCVGSAKASVDALGSALGSVMRDQWQRDGDGIAHSSVRPMQDVLAQATQRPMQMPRDTVPRDTDDHTARRYVTKQV
jgi:hypothetical protein